MTDQAILDLARTDAVARRGDHVVVASHEGEIALIIDHALVARGHPVADEFLPGRVRIAPIFQEHHGVGTLDRALAELARRTTRAVAADHRDGMARHRLADRARSRDTNEGAARQHEIAFGLAVEFVDDKAERGLAPLVGLGPERLAARTDCAQRRRVTRA